MNYPEKDELRTIAEIKAKIDSQKNCDLFGTFVDLLEYLPFNDAKEYLKPEITAEQWTNKALSKGTIIAEMKKYMIFALEKASNHRGLSSSRSIDHFKNWLWLLGDDETLAFAEDDCNYQNYGAPILKKICEVYGFDFPNNEDIQNMAKGLPCYEGCEMGCGN